MNVATVHHNSADLYVETVGTGPAILLIHSGVTDARMWDDVWTPFAVRNRAIRYDLRGFGRSTMPHASYAHHEDGVSVLNACGAERAVVIGASIGGGVALDLALAHPERVAGLILINTLAGMEVPSPELRAGWDAVNAACDAGDLDWATELELRMWVDGPTRQPHQVDAAIRERVRVMDRALLGRAEEAVDAEEIELSPPAKQRLSEIVCPVLLIVGLLDFSDALSSAATLQAGISNVHRVDIPHAAHLPSMENPGAVLAASISFLATLGW